MYLKPNLNSSNGDGTDSDMGSLYKVFTFDYVIKKLTEHSDDNAAEYVS